MQDTSDIYEYSSNKKIDEYVGWDYHKSIDDTTKFVQNILDKYSDNLPSEWGIIYKKEGKIIGTCGFEQLNLDHKSAGIGYVLSRKYWNKGIVTEAIQEVLRHNFENLGMNRVQIICDVNNIASSRVAEKVGMEYEGILREKFYLKKRFMNIKIYSILKREWIKIRNQKS